jgi:hypothetical protein
MPPRPSVPSPSTWTSGEIVTAPQLRSDVSNAVSLFLIPPSFFGGQTVTTQGITNNNWTGVELDSEYMDWWNGHRQNTGASSANYYAPLAGYYLAEVSCAFPPAGSSLCSAGFQFSSGGGVLVNVGCQRALANATRNIQVGGSFLVAQSTITGWGTGDYVGAAAWQNTGASEDLINATAQFPAMSARWVGALTGTEPLPVPTNPAFPSPPAPLGFAFMNANVRDGISFLAYPPLFEASYAAGTATLASATSLPSTGALLKMDSVGIDTYGAYSTSTGKWTAPVAGIYYWYAQTSLATAAGALALASGATVTSPNYSAGTAQTMWGGGMQAATSTTNVAIWRRRLRLNAGDTVSCSGWYRDSAAAAATVVGSGQWQTRILSVWEGA